MHQNPQVKIIDITKSRKHEIYLYKCLAPMPFRKYKRRISYLTKATPKGFRKKIILLDESIVGQIEYAPAEVSGLPIMGDGIFVMNCIWVLRKAKGHNLGKALLNDTIRSIRKDGGNGLATIGLESHPSPWMKKDQMEKLGFEEIDSFRMELVIRHKKPFRIYLMWMPLRKNVKKPRWNKRKLLEGVDFCMAHPLYNPESINLKQIFKKR